MGVHFGKPGTRRYRGRFRAQLRVGVAKLNEWNEFHIREGLKVPPVVVFTPAQLTIIQQADVIGQQLLAQVNT